LSFEGGKVGEVRRRGGREGNRRKESKGSK